MTTSLLLAAAALHLGFQATVTLLVYPALSRVPPERWAVEHDRHSRAITPLVGVVYLALAAACLGALVEARSVATLVACGGALLSAAVTAGWAAPLHGRLTSYDAGLVARLLRVDRLRLVGALLCAGGALAAVLG